MVKIKKYPREGGKVVEKQFRSALITRPSQITTRPALKVSHRLNEVEPAVEHLDSHERVSRYEKSTTREVNDKRRRVRRGKEKGTGGKEKGKFSVTSGNFKKSKEFTTLL